MRTTKIESNGFLMLPADQKFMQITKEISVEFIEYASVNRCRKCQIKKGLGCVACSPQSIWEPRRDGKIGYWKVTSESIKHDYSPKKQLEEKNEMTLESLLVSIDKKDVPDELKNSFKSMLIEKRDLTESMLLFANFLMKQINERYIEETIKRVVTAILSEDKEVIEASNDENQRIQKSLENWYEGDNDFIPLLEFISDFCLSKRVIDLEFAKIDYKSIKKMLLTN